MNEVVTTNGSGGDLMETKEVKELFDILKENGKDTAGLHALLDYVSDMEFLVKRAENQITDMKSQLDTMKEIQEHPIKSSMQKTMNTLKTNIAEIKNKISQLKANIIEGCKKLLSAFKEKGTTVLDKIASFLHIKDGLQAIKNDTVKNVNNCDKEIANIETFSKEYHTAGRAFKNMARMAVGKKPIDTLKESGKLAKAVSAPYKAQKSIQLGIRKQVDKMINGLDNLELSANKIRDERAVKPKKPTLIQRLNEKKKEIKERERETPKKDRVKTQGAEL